MSPRWVVVAALAALAAGCSKCATDTRATASNDGSAAPADGGDPEAESDREGHTGGDGGARRAARGAAEPKNEQTLLDATTIDASCAGASLDLALVIADPRCAIPSSSAKAIRAAFEKAPPLGLKQEVKRLEGARVEVRLVNGGGKPVTLPLSFHPKIAAFVVLADDDVQQAVYELESPMLEVALPDSGAGAARFARIVLLPGGVAFARVTIDPRITRRLSGRCIDGGCSPPARLANGQRYRLHVGQLVTDVETGVPASVVFEPP